MIQEDTVKKNSPVRITTSYVNSDQKPLRSPTPKPTPSQVPSQDSRCPVCNVVFEPGMTLRQRTLHVEKCLTNGTTKKKKEPSKPVKKSKKVVDDEDDLWEHEGTSEDEPFEGVVPDPVMKRSTSSTHSKSVHHQVTSTRNVLYDDGEDDYYYSLVYSFLQWKNTKNTEEEQSRFYREFEEQASWVNGGVTTQSYHTKKEMSSLLDWYYLHEPCLLLATGHLIPTQLWENLYPYQRKGVLWILGLHTQQVGGILADEMGLGKTLQIVAALIALKFTKEATRLGRKNLDQPPAEEGEIQSGSLDLNTSSLPSLLIVPATLLGHWLRELRQWCPLLRSVIVHNMSQTVMNGDSLQSILVQCQQRHRYDVIITTYEGFRQSSLYRKQDWFYAILDEGGKIKNANVAISKKCKRLRTVHRLLISGTPLQNSLKEFWSLIDYVYPGKLGTFEAFNSTVVVPIHRGIYSNASRQASSLGYQRSLMLHDTISPYILRRLKKVMIGFHSYLIGCEEGTSSKNRAGTCM